MLSEVYLIESYFDPNMKLDSFIRCMVDYNAHLHTSNGYWYYNIDKGCIEYFRYNWGVEESYTQSFETLYMIDYLGRKATISLIGAPTSVRYLCQHTM